MATRQTLAQSEADSHRFAATLIRPRGRASGLDSMANTAATEMPISLQLRGDRWRQRRTVRRVLSGTRVAGCGRPVNKAVGVGLYWSETHGARYQGLRTCGSVWVCPVCNHKIQSGRQEEVKKVLDHCRDHTWGVVFGTLTVRHQRTDSLKAVIDMAREVWRKSRSHRRIKDLFTRIHEVGYLRAMEITYSRVNGWHVHFHVFYVFDHILTRAEAGDFAGVYAAEWVQTAKRCGYAAPLAKNQRFETLDLTRVSTLAAAAKYCTISKTATTPQTSRLSHEVTNTQSKFGTYKTHGNGRRVLHLTYWDFVRILTDATDESERALSANYSGVLETA